MSNVIEVKVPDIGDYKDVEIIEVMVAPGDTIQKEDSLISLESDKATMEIPSTAAGTVKELKVNVGDKVSEGSVILLLEAASETTDKTPQDEKEKDSKPEPAATEKQILVPDIGDFNEVEIIDVLVSEGDDIEVESPLISLESDKATMDIPSPYAGKIKSLLIKNGDMVSEGSPIAVIIATDTVSETDKIEKVTKQADEAAAVNETKPPEPPPRPTQPAGAVLSAAGGVPYASPSIRKFARELGVDLTRVQGSGRKGRIVRDDVTAFTRAVMAGTGDVGSHWALDLFERSEVDFSQFGEIEAVPLTRLNKLSSQNLHKSWINIPHVTNFDETDITELEEYRVSKKKEAEKHGTKLTILSFLIKAAVAVLKKYPRFNSSLAANGEELIIKKYYNIGFAVNTEAGLMVPVVKNADDKGIYELAMELADLAQKARDKKLPPSDMQGACFTISSLGHIGGTGFTPIINPPEVAIMGVSKANLRPVYIDGKIEPRLILPFSLSYDHRVIDGVAAAEFTRAMGEVLSDIRELIL